MASATEGQYAGEFILAESPGAISRDTVTVTVPAATKMAPGTVLGQLSATGKYVPYDDAETDGREDAAGVLYGELDNSASESAADVSGVIINWGAEVRSSDLVWEDGVDETAGAADLAALGVKARS